MEDEGQKHLSAMISLRPLLPPVKWGQIRDRIWDV